MKTKKKRKTAAPAESFLMDVPQEASVKPNGALHLESRAEAPADPKPFYNPDDAVTLSYTQDIGNPGEYPYTRGIYFNMYRAKLWTLRQAAGGGTSREANRYLKQLLAQGQTGVACNFDLPTLLGYDSDHPRSFGEVGKAGTAVDSLQDMEEIFSGIRLDQTSAALNANGTAAFLYSMYLATAEKQGVKIKDLCGTVQNDVLIDFMLQDTCLFPPEFSLKLFTDLLKFSGDKTPHFHAVAVSGYPLREAGATIPQELAFALAAGFAYVDEGLRAGLEIDQFVPSFSFYFGSGPDLLEEVAKFRAARRVWARWMKEKFKARDPRAWQMKLHARTLCDAGKQSSDQAAVRATLGALAAVLGGAQSLHAGAENFQGLRLQQILAYESGAAKYADSLGGSYLLESLTARLEEEAEAYFKKIDETGGVLRGIQSGFFQKEILAGAASRQRPQEKTVPAAVKAEPVSDREQVEKLKLLKRTRSKKDAEKALKDLRKAAEGKRNLIPAILDCARSYVTLGETVYELKSFFGEYQPPSVF